MDPTFRAGRGLGRAEMARLNQKMGANFLQEVISELARAKIPGIQPELNELQAIIRDWRARSDRLQGIISAIRDQRLGGNGKGYQAFCSGFLLGLAMEACLQIDKDTVTARVKDEVIGWLDMAKKHTSALKAQGFLPHMQVFDSQFNTIINPIMVVKRSAELRNFYQLIEKLSNDVGNAISRAR
jgi:hypothetical protein